VFWVISVYFTIRNTLPKSGTFLLGHPVYIYIYIYNYYYEIIAQELLVTRLSSCFLDAGLGNCGMFPWKAPTSLLAKSINHEAPHYAELNITRNEHCDIRNHLEHRILPCYELCTLCSSY
jgi:hypothetical protein